MNLLVVELTLPVLNPTGGGIHLLTVGGFIAENFSASRYDLNTVERDLKLQTVIITVTR